MCAVTCGAVVNCVCIWIPGGWSLSVSGGVLCCSLPGGFGGAPSEACRDQVETGTGLRQPTVAVDTVELCSRKTEMLLNL